MSCELGVVSGEDCEIVVFEKKDFERRIKEPWDVIISTGTNELLDLYDFFLLPLSLTPPLSTPSLPHFPWPVIQQFHTNPKSQFKWKRFLRNWKIRRALRCVNAIQVLSEEFVPQVKKYGVPVHVIGNWSKFSCELRVKSLELPAHNSQLPTPPLLHSSTPTIIYPAAFAKGKNQKLLIRAFAKVSAEFPEWRLRLLGRAEGRYADECRRLADELEMRVGVGEQGTGKREQGTGNGRIEFAGFCEDMAAEYERCAFVAFPSLDEGFSLVIADAAAFAKPCVMVRDWIGTAGSGGVMTKAAVEAYAEELRRLMSDAELRRQMGERAREFCANHYSREKILNKWEELVKQVVKRDGTIYHA